MNVLIVDDEQLARQRLRHMLNEMGDYAVIGEAENGVDGGSVRARHFRLDAVIGAENKPGTVDQKNMVRLLAHWAGVPLKENFKTLVFLAYPNRGKSRGAHPEVIHRSSPRRRPVVPVSSLCRPCVVGKSSLCRPYVVLVSSLCRRNVIIFCRLLRQ